MQIQIQMTGQNYVICGQVILEHILQIEDGLNIKRDWKNLIIIIMRINYQKLKVRIYHYVSKVT